MSAHPTLTLTYFDIPGRAEAIRKTLSLANIPFVDQRLSPKAFADQKATFPYGAVPVLDVDGQRFAEMQAILRYAGRLTGLYPPSSERVAGALVDEVLDAFEDLFTRLLIPSMMENDDAKKKAMRLALLGGPLPQTLALLNARLAHIATLPFFQNDPANVYVHDVMVWDFVHNVTSGALDYLPASLLDGFPTMASIYDKVALFKGNNQPRPTQLEASSPPSSQLTLTYFDMPGRAETIRLTLHLGGVAFEDERLSYEQYLARRHAFPYGHMPVLAVDGELLAQSAAILRYAGSLTGLYPADDALAAMRVDEVVSHISELFYAFDPWFSEQDAQKRRVLGETLAASTVPASLASLEKRVAQWKTTTAPAGFTTGSTTPTIADLMVSGLVQFLEHEFFAADATKPMDAYAHLVAISKAVGALPRVVDFYATQGKPTA